MGITAIVCIAALVVVIVIILTILVYNQMLLLNEMNKRLLLLTKEAIEHERLTQEELQDALVTIEQMSNSDSTNIPSTKQPDEYNGFHDDDLDI